MKNCFISRNNAQASIEFSLALILAVLFLVLTCNLFVWLNHNIVQRQRGYEASRIIAATSPEAENPNAKGKAEPGKLDFYTTPKLNVFTPGGIGKK